MPNSQNRKFTFGFLNNAQIEKALQVLKSRISHVKPKEKIFRPGVT